jgi:hypothetical protein
MRDFLAFFFSKGTVASKLFEIDFIDLKDVHIN